MALTDPYIRSYTDRINWVNSPNPSTPLSADNLNKGDYALQYHDYKLDEVYGIIQQLLPDFADFAVFKDTIYGYINDRFNQSYTNINYEESTAKFTFMKPSGSSKTVDLYLEKLPITFWFAVDEDHPEEGTQLYMRSTDGTETHVTLGHILEDLYNKAEASAEAARLSAEEAAISAEEASEDADRAENAISGSIIAAFDIDSDGHLQYTKIINGVFDPNKDVSFAIKNNENLEVSFNV